MYYSSTNHHRHRGSYGTSFTYVTSNSALLEMISQPSFNVKHFQDKNKKIRNKFQCIVCFMGEKVAIQVNFSGRGTKIWVKSETKQIMWNNVKYTTSKDSRNECTFSINCRDWALLVKQRLQLRKIQIIRSNVKYITSKYYWIECISFFNCGNWALLVKLRIQLQKIQIIQSDVKYITLKDY